MDGRRSSIQRLLCVVDRVSDKFKGLGSVFYGKDQSVCFPAEDEDKENRQSIICVNTDDNHQQFLLDCDNLLLSDLIASEVTKLEIDGVLFIENSEIVYEGLG